MNKVNSGFLFASPSFASGVARTLDLWGQFDTYNDSESGPEADAKALAVDWIVIGDDIQLAIDRGRESL